MTCIVIILYLLISFDRVQNGYLDIEVYTLYNDEFLFNIYNIVKRNLKKYGLVWSEEIWYGLHCLEPMYPFIKCEGGSELV